MGSDLGEVVNGLDSGLQLQYELFMRNCCFFSLSVSKADSGGDGSSGSKSNQGNAAILGQAERATSLILTKKKPKIRYILNT